MPTIAHLSDLHLQSGVPARQAQVEPILAEINRRKPDLVVISGDVTDDGWDSIEELKWAKAWLDERIESPQMVLPGNHDVGNFCDAEDGAITLDRVERWIQVFDDFCTYQIDNWAVLGWNSMRLGMEDESTREHLYELNFQVSENTYHTRHVAVFQHTPMFSKSIHEKDPAISYWVGSSFERQHTWQEFITHKIKLLGSGHVHQTRLAEIDGIKIAWAPPSSGTWVHAPGLPNPPMPEQTGFFLHHLHDDGRVESELIECAPMLKLYEHNPYS